MTRQTRSWTQLAGAVVTVLTILGALWRVADGWFALVHRVDRLEDRDHFVHGEYQLPQKGQ